MKTNSGNTAEVVRLLKPFSTWIVLPAVTGICAGGATVALLRTITDVLNQQRGMAGGLLLTFIVLCAVALLRRMAFDVFGKALLGATPSLGDAMCSESQAVHI